MVNREKTIAACLLNAQKRFLYCIIKLACAYMKYADRINVTQALSKMKDSIVHLFKRPNIMKILNKLFDLFIMTVEPVRPGRKYPRKHSVQKREFYFCYKPIR